MAKKIRRRARRAQKQGKPGKQVRSRTMQLLFPSRHDSVREETSDRLEQAPPKPGKSPGKFLIPLAAPEPAKKVSPPDLTLMSIRYRAIGELKENPKNARTHGPQQIGTLAASIKRFGFSCPIIVDENDVILAGHGRLQAAKMLGMAEVPVIERNDLTEALKRGFALADNQIATLAGWDEELLRAELRQLIEIEQAGALEFDIDILGFDTNQLDQAVVAPTVASDPADDLSDIALGQRAVARRGDTWHLGRHKLVCGDAREAPVYHQLLGKEQAQLVFSDPPYNVEIRGNVTTKKRHREFVAGSGELDDPQFVEFLRDFIRNTAAHSVSGAIAYICMDWRHIAELFEAARPVCGKPKNLCVWAKTNASMGTFYRSQHELVAVFKLGDDPHVNNFGLGAGGRYRTNLWSYAGANVFGKGRDDALAMHPTVKPVAMVADAIRDCSRRDSIVLDPFGGSGTTLIAAERTGRQARLIELDPLYCDVIIQRWQCLTGKPAHRHDGQRFDDLAEAEEGDGATPTSESPTKTPRQTERAARRRGPLAPSQGGRGARRHPRTPRSGGAHGKE